MPRDLISYPETVPDLTKPSFEALAYVLRHPKAWPANHIWDYRAANAKAPYSRLADEYADHFGTAGCAAGIAQLLWGYRRVEEAGMLVNDHTAIFNRAPETGGYEAVTPAHVADRIDDYLAGRPIRK